MVDRKQAPATTSTIRGEDWYARDLDGLAFDNVAFIDVDMTELTTRGVVFTECTFSSVRFNVTMHTESAFINCTFRQCNFFDATFTRCKLQGSVFIGCDLDLLKVDGGNWSFVGLAGAALGGTSFIGVRLREVDLTAARCVGTTFAACDLSGAWLRDADLTQADLRGSDISALNPGQTTVRGALIDVEQATVVAAAVGFVVS